MTSLRSLYRKHTSDPVKKLPLKRIGECMLISSRLTVKTLAGSLLSLLIPAAVIVSLPPHGNLANSADSISYLAVARQIAAGHGLTMPDFSLFAKSHGTFTTWPPLFPFILASGISPLWIQVCLVAALSAVTYTLFHRYLGWNWLMATVGALICVLSVPLMVDATYVWSEMTALFFTSLMILSLAKLSYDNYWRPWALALVFVAFAIYARYAMFLLVPALMVALLLAPLRTKLRINLTLLTPFVMALLSAPLIAHNYLSSDHISGAYRKVSDLRLATNIKDALVNTTSAFALGSYSKAILVICIIATVSIIIYHSKAAFIESSTAPPASSTQAKWLTTLTMTTALIYFSGMIVLRTAVDFDPLDTRLMSPMIYLIMLTTCAYMTIVWQRTTAQHSWERAVLVSPLAVLLALSVHNSVVSGTHAWKRWRTTGCPYWRMNSLYSYNNLQPIHAPKLSGIVLSARPLAFNYLTGWDTRKIPSETLTKGTLKRIASTASAIMITGRKTELLANEILPLVKQPRVLYLRGLHIVAHNVIPVLHWQAPS